MKTMKSLRTSTHFSSRSRSSAWTYKEDRQQVSRSRCRGASDRNGGQVIDEPKASGGKAALRTTFYEAFGSYPENPEMKLAWTSTLMPTITSRSLPEDRLCATTKSSHRRKKPTNTKQRSTH